MPGRLLKPTLINSCGSVTCGRYYLFPFFPFTMNKVAEYSSLDDGFASNECFVVRGLNLPCHLPVCKERAAASDIELFGYGRNGETLLIMASEALDRYENGVLDINIVDAPFPVLLPDEIPPLLLQLITQSEADICLTLTQKNKYTPLHIDPDMGGGWMYLQSGVKKWQLIPAEYLEQFQGEGQNWDDNLLDPPADYDAAILLETTIRGGDFIYFPPNTMHRVWTYEDSFGVSGYAYMESGAG